MSRTKDRLRDDMEMSLSDVIQSTSIKYDTVPFSIEEDYDSDTDDHPINMNKSRRWSILDKLERRHYCRVRSCSEFLNILSFKCFFATCMLVFFVVLALTLAHEMLSINVGGPDRYDFIIVGGGAAGSTIARKLTDSGASVLLLEAGTSTQYDLGGKDYFGGPVTRFDIPFLWPSIPHFPDYRWNGFNLPGVTFAKGIGGSELHSAMTYVRTHPADIEKWNVPGWTWSRVLRTFMRIESYMAEDDFTLQRLSTGESAQSNSPKSVSVSSSCLYQGVCPAFHSADGLIPTTRYSFAIASLLSQQYLLSARLPHLMPPSTVSHMLVTSSPPLLDGIGSDFVSSAVNSGIPFTPDFNDPTGREGVGYYHFNLKGGTRMSAARVMLGPIMRTRANLRVELGATVKRVILAELPYTPSTTADATTSRGKKWNRKTEGSAANQTQDMADGLRLHPSQQSYTPPRQGRGLSDAPASEEYKATGVEYEQNGVTKRVYLKTSMIAMESAPFSRMGVRSVILSAGAVMTPMLLMGSGIGPKEALEGAGIKVLLPVEGVGRNLQNQPAVGVTVMLQEAALAGYPSAYSIASEWDKYVEAVTQDRAGVTVSKDDFGILGTVGLSAGAFLVSPYSSDGVPDLQLTAYPKVIEPHLSSRSDRFSEESVPPETLLSGNQMLITVTLLSPDGRLKVTLNTSDPLSAPLIVHSCPFRAPPAVTLGPRGSSGAAALRERTTGLSSRTEDSRPKDITGKNASDVLMPPSSDPSKETSPDECVDDWSADNATDLNSVFYLTDKDLMRLVWGIEQVRRILSFAPLSALTGEEVSPGQKVSSPEDMTLWVRANAYSTSSWVGSAAMGAAGTEATTVVDDSLCVWGTQGLRVADASAIPLSPAGDVRSTVVMLGAAAAEIILTEAKLFPV